MGSHLGHTRLALGPFCDDLASVKYDCMSKALMRGISTTARKLQGHRFAKCEFRNDAGKVMCESQPKGFRFNDFTTIVRTESGLNSSAILYRGDEIREPTGRRRHSSSCGVCSQNFLSREK